MNKDTKPYADEAYGIVQTAANEIGSRLPGSEGEKKFAEMMANKLSDIGIKPVKEKFLVAPRASIGGIPYAGWIGIACAVAMYFQQLYGLVFFVCLLTWVWMVCSVFLYKTWFDFVFPQESSQNVYGELLPKKGNYDYTIMLSAHLDTSWNWKHSAQKPALAFVKMGWGILSFLFLTVASLAMFIIYCKYVYVSPDYSTMTAAELIRMNEILDGAADFRIALYVLLAVFVIPGCYFITMWADKNPRTASPGAMDNATGISLAYAVTKYFKEHPDRMPANCRIIDMNCGSEEAGLRGSIAFTRRHKGEDILRNCYNINIDSIADKDHFEVINGDVWQFTRFDKELEDMFFEAMKESGIEKPSRMKNPVGGCDSTPMTKAGVKSITFAAQNPVLTQYYHTFYDVPDRFDVDVMHQGLDVILRVIDKIAAKENARSEMMKQANETADRNEEFEEIVISEPVETQEE